VAAGAHAIETDLHLSRDGVAVLSHVSRDFQLSTLHTK
jgi:glycerophosphoryl diester phosphodiesterase